MTTTEEHIIDTLIKNGKAEILFDYDHYYVDDLVNEAGTFARKYQKRHPEWLKDGIANRLQTEEKTIHIISACGNAMQAKALQAKLQEIHDEKQDKAQETQDEKQAVILADENLLIPVLNSIPNSCLGFKVSMGYPLNQTPVNQLIKACFALSRRDKINRYITENGTKRQVEGFYIWPILQLMDLEIVKIIFPRHELDAFSQWKYKTVKEGKFIFEGNDIEALQQMPNIQAFLKVILTRDSELSPTAMLNIASQLLAFVAHLLQSKTEQYQNHFLLNQVSEIGKIISRLHSIISLRKTPNTSKMHTALRHCIGCFRRQRV